MKKYIKNVTCYMLPKIILVAMTESLSKRFLLTAIQ